jgi:hypothetical protein
LYPIYQIETIGNIDEETVNIAEPPISDVLEFGSFTGWGVMVDGLYELSQSVGWSRGNIINRTEASWIVTKSPTERVDKPREML